MKMLFLLRSQGLTIFGRMAIVILFFAATARSHTSETNQYEFNDSHCHLTNNIQEGPSVRDFLNMMGTTVGRTTLFGVPLEQEWLYGVDGDRAPTCYLHSHAPLYYYSFTDAWIAMAYKSLPNSGESLHADPIGRFIFAFQLQRRNRGFAIEVSGEPLAYVNLH
jgi:hypothetical protein